MLFCSFNFLHSVRVHSFGKPKILITICFTSLFTNNNKKTFQTGQGGEGCPPIPCEGPLRKFLECSQDYADTDLNKCAALFEKLRICSENQNQ